MRKDGIDKTQMKKWLLIIAGLVLGVAQAHAYLLVEDIPQLTQGAISEVRNYAQWLQQTANQVQQINNQVVQIQNQVTALTRFGNPAYYVNLLNLDSFKATASVLSSGIGQTMNAYRQVANGLTALGYTGNGLYSDLVGAVDRYGNPIQFNMHAFNKFAVVDNMLDSYNTQQQTYNAQMASLQAQLTTALQNLNSAPDHMTAQKYAAQVNAISAQIQALGHTTNLTGQRAAIQQLANQNDAARTQEASRQQRNQEMQTDLQRQEQGFQNLIGGSVQ
jgi:paraquat-inducible protein B